MDFPRRGPRVVVACLIAVVLLAHLPTPAAEVPWPAETLGNAVNLTAIEGPGTNDFYVNLSSAFWNPVTRRLWVCRNGGTDGSKFWALREDGNGSFEVDVQGGLRGEWANFGDLEAVTQANYNEPVLYLMVEGEERIKECNVSTYGTAVISNNWNTSPYLPLSGGSGAEGLCFVPDSFLSAAGFVDQNGNPYVSQNGMGGVMFVAHQNGGRIYAFDLNRSNGTFTYVGAYKTNFSESCELAFDRSDGRMYILHGADHNTVEVTNLSSTVVGGERQFSELVTYGRPTGSPSSWNLEGFAIMPNTECSNGQRSVFLTIDDGGSQSLLWYKQFPCSCGSGDPNITTHPVSATICSSSTNQFCVVASGTGTLTYQWQKNGSNIVGATSTCYTAATAGDYQCVVSSGCGTATSNSATLTVLVAPTISTHPTGGTACSGQVSQLCVAATGSGTLAYQWQKSGVNISGANSTCFTPGTSGSYRCLVSNSCGSATSNSATVTVDIAPTISVHPSGETGCSGDMTPLCVTATGSGTLAYQWQQNGSDIQAATSSCYTPGESGSYRCVVTNSCGSSTSNSASVTVNGAPIISVHPAGETTCSGQVTPLCVSASGIGVLTYQWQLDNSDIQGATGTCYSPTASGSYLCVVSNSCGSTNSNIASVTANAAPEILAQPVNGSICVGHVYEFCISSTGDSVSYQWQESEMDIDGATSACFITGKADTYRCVVSNTCGATYSNVALLNVRATPTWYKDADDDGYGSPTEIINACDAPVGYVSNGLDCDDNSPDINPAMAEFCDSKDNNCNGRIDEECITADVDQNEPISANDSESLATNGSACGAMSASGAAALFMGMLAMLPNRVNVRRRGSRCR